VLGRDDYRQAALHNAEFLLRELSTTADGAAGQARRLLRTWKDGRAKLNGYLEDYANLTEGLIALYEATFDPHWLREARGLADAMVDQFWSGALGGFYDTGRDHEALITRPRDVFDNATPSGGAVAASVLLKLAAMFGDEDVSRRAVESLKGVSALMKRYPSGFGQWLNALDFYLDHPKEIALIGSAGAPDSQPLIDAIFRTYLPNRIIMQQAEESASPGGPLLEGKTMLRGRPTVYVCQNYMCRAPVTDVAALEKQLTD